MTRIQRRRRFLAAAFSLLGAGLRRSEAFCPPFVAKTSAALPRLRQGHSHNVEVTSTSTSLPATATAITTNADDRKEGNDIYDAIVIGSGMSGLVAGNYLAKRGRRVLLVESHSIPGGYTTNFRRGGFRFEVSTHIINGCDPDGAVGKVLRDFDITDDDIDFVQLRSLLRWIDPARGIDAVLPVGIEAYVDKLCSLFPHEEKGIREFHDRYYPLAAWVVEYEKRHGLNQILHVLWNLPILGRLLSLRRKTAADILDPLITDPACREVLTVMTALFGLHYTELDAAIFVMGSMMFHAGGAYYPVGGSGKISKVLADRFSDYGGVLRFNNHVDEIRFDEDGVANGVQMKDRKGNVSVEKARCVINCSDLSNLVNKLCPEGILPNNYVRGVRKRIPGNSLVLAWAGLDIDLREKGITDFEIIRSNNKSKQMKDTNMLDQIMNSADYSDLPVSGATIYSNIDATCCPPGKSVISTNFMASYDAFARTLGPGGDMSSKKYHALKDRVEDQLLGQMAKAIDVPDLAKHVEVMELATPITFERYTDNLGGSFMGWRLTPKQGAFSNFSPRTPVRNLFTCGQWLGVGGIASVMTTGLDAAKLADCFLGKLDKAKENDDSTATKSPKGSDEEFILGLAAPG